MNIMKNVPQFENTFTAIAAPIIFASLTVLTITNTYQQFTNNSVDESPYSGLEYVFDQYINPLTMPIATVVSIGVLGASAIRSYEYFSGDHLE